LREIMAQKDARIHFLERELAEREKEMQMMKEREQLPVAGWTMNACVNWSGKCASSMHW
jgi:hypothetical protein